MGNPQRDIMLEKDVLTTMFVNGAESHGELEYECCQNS